jgi:hypothetical protein
MTTRVTTAPGCPAATDGQHEYHWFTVPALYVNMKLRRPSYERALCFRCNEQIGGQS